MATIHPPLVMSEIEARSRKPRGGFWWKQTFIVAVANDWMWVDMSTAAISILAPVDVL